VVSMPQSAKTTLERRMRMRIRFRRPFQCLNRQKQLWNRMRSARRGHCPARFNASIGKNNFGTCALWLEWTVIGTRFNASIGKNNFGTLHPGLAGGPPTHSFNASIGKNNFGTLQPHRKGEAGREVSMPQSAKTTLERYPPIIMSGITACFNASIGKNNFGTTETIVRTGAPLTGFNASIGKNNFGTARGLARWATTGSFNASIGKNNFGTASDRFACHRYASVSMPQSAKTTLEPGLLR